MSKVPEENRCVCGKTELKEGKTEDEVAAENKQDSEQSGCILA